MPDTDPTPIYTALLEEQGVTPLPEPQEQDQ